MQLCSKPSGARGIEPETFRRRGQLLSRPPTTGPKSHMCTFVVLHLLSSPSSRREVGASWTDVAVTLVAGIGGPAAEVAGLVARPLPLGELARVVAQLGCDHGLH